MERRTFVRKLVSAIPAVGLVWGSAALAKTLKKHQAFPPSCPYPGGFTKCPTKTCITTGRCSMA